MAKTNLQRNASYYERIIKEAQQSKYASHYRTVCDALKELVQLTKKLKGVNHKMSPNEYEKITKSYQAVHKACEDYIKEINNFDDFEKKYERIIKDISSVVKKDLNVLLTCNPLTPRSLSDIMDQARTHKIILDKDAIKMVGGVMSSRIPLRTNSGRKGFFTPKSIYNPDEKWTEKLKNFEDKFIKISANCRENLDLLKKDGAFQLQISRCIPKMPITEKTKYTDETKSKVADLALTLGLGLGNNRKEVRRFFRNNKDVYNTLVEFSNSVVNLAMQQKVMHKAGIQKGDNISSRNCAMTDVAKLLGCQKLLANSVPMTIEVDGKQIEGVFMESAQGSDIHHLEADDLLLSAKGESFENPEALQQVLDLQVLDYICGNVDRHTGNMFYQFKKSSSGNIKFMGIQGIDNDCSFGRMKLTSDERVMKLVNPENMKYITKSMASTLDKMDPNMLRFKLAHHKFSDAEIEGALERLQMVKDAVEKGTIKKIDKDHWKKKPLMKNDMSNSYIKYIQNMASKCQHNLYKENTNEKNRISYAQEIRTANHIMADNENKIKDLRKMLDNVNIRFFNSSEYKLMEKRFEKIEEITQEIRLHTNPKDVPEPLTNALRKAYIELHEKTDIYISLKKLVPSSESGQKRLNFAKELKDFAEETLDKLGVKFEKEEEKDKGKEKDEINEMCI